MGRILALVAVIGLVLVGDAVALVTIEPGPSHPSEWDARVADLAAFVESERGLRFEHPVQVDFLSAAEYRDQVLTDEATLTDEDRAEVKRVSGEARALGLLPDGVDLLKSLNQLEEEGTLAYYDPAEERVVVRGRELTVGLRVTLVHELTHALQDQHFDIDRELDDDAADTIFQALVEGDAQRIESIYVDQLDDDEQEAYADEEEAASNDASLDDVPAALLQLFGAPYALGEPMVTVLVKEKGKAALDELLREPPSSDESLMDPFAMLDGDAPTPVRRPRLRAGERSLEGGAFGALAWYVVLASRVDARTAIKAVDGWDGDAYVTYRRDGRTCMRIDVVGDAPSDLDEMAAALEQWRAPFPPGAVTVRRIDGGVELDACDPGTVPPLDPAAADALSLPVARWALVGQVLSGGLPRSAARCMVGEFLARVELDELEPQTEADARALIELGTQIGLACRDSVRG